jgi:NADH:ubiquinone oxidoreductase subunit E
MKTKDIVKQRGNSRTNLLQILHDLQDSSGDNSLHRDEIEALAKEMDIPVSDIVGTATFYSMFSFEPRGRHIIRLCESPPCYVMGEENVLAAIGSKLGIGFGETTADGCFTLEPTSCLGACGVAPVMMIDDEIYGNLTEAKVAEILDLVASADRGAAAD